MKRITFWLLSLAVAVSVGACAKNNNNPRMEPTISEHKPKNKKRVRQSGGFDQPPIICPKNLESNAVAEFATKAEGHPGYVNSPFDPQRRLIDVRGLPPGTESECPYTRRTFLVPP